MKSLKSVLAVIAAICLVACLTVPVFATENVTLTTGTTSTDATTTAATTGETQPEEGYEDAQQSGVEVEEGDIQVPLTTDATTGEEEEETHDHDHATEETAGHKALRVVLTVLEVITSVVLVVIVLIQSGKEAGLSGAIAGNSDSYMSKGKRATLDKKLASLTKWVALAWVVLTLALSLI